MTDWRNVGGGGGGSTGNNSGSSAGSSAVHTGGGIKSDGELSATESMPAVVGSRTGGGGKLTAGDPSSMNRGGGRRRKHWKLPDMIQGVRHRFRDKLVRSKSPDYMLDGKGSQSSVYRYTAHTEGSFTRTPIGSSGSLSRTASLLSTDYGFNDWDLEDLTPTNRVTALGSSVGPGSGGIWRAPTPGSDISGPLGPAGGGGYSTAPASSTFMPNSARLIQSVNASFNSTNSTNNTNSSSSGCSSIVQSAQQHQLQPHHNLLRGGSTGATTAAASIVNDSGGVYSASQLRYMVNSLPRNTTSFDGLSGGSGQFNKAGYDGPNMMAGADVVGNSYSGGGVHGYHQHQRAMSVSDVQSLVGGQYAAANNQFGTLQHQPPLRRQTHDNNPEVHHHVGPEVPASNNVGTISRGKSVRFGENRISVFLQDSTQALEECVRLALSYANEVDTTKRSDYCSDSEAVTLSRQLANNGYDDPGGKRALAGGCGGISPAGGCNTFHGGGGKRSFWSDSEDHHSYHQQQEDDDGLTGLYGQPASAPPSAGSAVTSDYCYENNGKLTMTDSGANNPPTFNSFGRSGGSNGTAKVSGAQAAGTKEAECVGGGSKNSDYVPSSRSGHRPARASSSSAASSSLTATSSHGLGQAVNSLDRGVERTDRYRRQRQRTTHLNEIFSFIDKVLSGCENGCSDAGCPLARATPPGNSSTYNVHNNDNNNSSNSSSNNNNNHNNSKSNSNHNNHRKTNASTEDTKLYAYSDTISQGVISSRATGYESSDSDCDTGSTNSTVRGRSGGRNHRPNSGGGGGSGGGGRLSATGRGRSAAKRSSRGSGGSHKRTTEDIFAQIMVCSESSREPVGMPKYTHVHQKISQTVCNAIFLCKISDDDRMSLTTAISEDDDAESNHNSPYKAKQSGSAASFNCTGAVRKAGFLSVKKWLLRKKHQVELARKRGWKGYWVCLKGTTLLFYPCDSREGRSVEATPKHLIIVDGSILQPIPEHPKRDFIFCLSTAFGDAYLFQAPCQVELENWVNSIHSACAAAFARHRGKTGTLHLLQEEIYRLEKSIESDQKLKHMAELQLSVVADPGSKHQIQGQISNWEENLERLQVEQFRLRCYMASLQAGELPNPKGVLTQISRPTKTTLNRLGVFTVSSLHAYICARSPSLLNNLLAGRGATKRRAPMLSRNNSSVGRRSLQGSGLTMDTEKHIQVTLPDNQVVTVFLRDAMTVEEFLAACCTKRGLSPNEHFIRVKKRKDMPSINYFVPHRSDLIETYLATHEVVAVCSKILYQVELARNTLEIMWGFSVEAELVENSDKQDELCCYVSRVEDRSVAMENGIIKGDEIMVINGAIVSDLDMMFIESVLQEEMSLCMMMRSSRTEPPDLQACVIKTTDDIIESLVCPPPPSDSALNEDVISSLIVPAPKWNKETVSPDGESTAPPSDRSDRSSGHLTSERGSGLLQSERDSGIGGITIPNTRHRNMNNSPQAADIIGNQPPLDVEAVLRQQAKLSPTGSVASIASQQYGNSRQLTDGEKLRKVIIELVETERTYVKHLSYLMNTYLEPLRQETFLSNAEVGALFGNIQEIFSFQQQFLHTLENALDTEAQFYNLETPPQFKNILFSIGSAFLYYVNHFKLYSSFCASHSKAQKVLHPNEGNQALQEFLLSCNPKQQHSTAIESYLIKPIQRILKYPLLLTQLKNLTDPNSDEHQHLTEALLGMEKVAEHINEMQRIHEEYGAIFDHLYRQHQKSSKQPIDLSPGDLLYYGGVEWLNIADFLGKIKKGLELHAMCFVFKTAVVFLCKERLRQKKKSLIGGSNKTSGAEVEIIRYQVLIPVTEVQVKASTVKDMTGHYLWELIHLKSQIHRRLEKVYHLSNSTSDFRNAFLKTIRQIIRESVRNMSLPPPDVSRRPEPPIRSESTKLTNSEVEMSMGGGGGSGGSGSNGSRGSGSSGLHHAQGTHTLQLTRKKPAGQSSKQSYNSLQRHSSASIDARSLASAHDRQMHSSSHNLDYDNVEGAINGSRSNRNLGDGLDELADLALHSESDSVRDECSSGIRSEGEDEGANHGDHRTSNRSGPPRRAESMGTPHALSWGSTTELQQHHHFSRSQQHHGGSTSTLSSCSSQQQQLGGARLLQSSLQQQQQQQGQQQPRGVGDAPPPPPPRTSSAAGSINNINNNSNTNTSDSGGMAGSTASSDPGSPVWKPRDGGHNIGGGSSDSRRENLHSACRMLDDLLQQLTSFS